LLLLLLADSEKANIFLAKTASGGDPCGVLLEFKLPSRIIASKQSMTDRRRARRAFGLRRGERKYENMHVSP
jgi:hypothetical protein